MTCKFLNSRFSPSCSLKAPSTTESALDIADDVEGLDAAKWNLQVVQKRPGREGAIDLFKGFPMFFLLDKGGRCGQLSPRFAYSFPLLPW